MEEVEQQLKQSQVDLMSQQNRDYSEIGERIVNLKSRNEELLLKQATLDNKKSRLNEILPFLEKSKFEPTEYDEN